MARRSRRREVEEDDENSSQPSQEEEENEVEQDKTQNTNNDNDDDDVVLTKEDEVKLLDDSGLSDQTRRVIRQKQRKLLKDMEDAEEPDVDNFRNENNALYLKVRFTREAVLDSENLDMIAKKTARRVDRLIQVPRYDADRLCNKLSKKFQVGGSFNWELFGREAGICFNAVPSDVSFLNGPLMDGIERKERERKKPVRQQVEEETAAEQKPQNVDQSTTVKDADQLSAIESSMRVLSKTLKKKVNEGYKQKKEEIIQMTGLSPLPPDLDKKLKKYGVGADAIQYLFNPDSFTQTVENIFHFSFLIKKGNATIAVREAKKITAKDKDGVEREIELCKGGPYVKYNVSDETQNHPPNRQAIVTLTMKDWRELCKVYGVQKGDLPHRTGSKFTSQARSPSQKRKRGSS